MKKVKKIKLDEANEKDYRTLLNFMRDKVFTIYGYSFAITGIIAFILAITNPVSLIWLLLATAAAFPISVKQLLLKPLKRSDLKSCFPNLDTNISLVDLELNLDYYNKQCEDEYEIAQVKKVREEFAKDNKHCYKRLNYDCKITEEEMETVKQKVKTLGARKNG